MSAFLNIPLRTSRLLLRPYCPVDAQALFAIFSDPLVMRYWSTPPWNSIEQAHRAIESDSRSLESGQQLRLGIERIDDSTLIGQCTLFNIVRSCRRAEIGYCLSSATWGLGYMHEALQELVRYGFVDLDLNRIEADIDPRNAASAKSLLRLGFVEEGLLRERWIVNEEISDSSLYGLLRKDWEVTREYASSCASPAAALSHQDGGSGTDAATGAPGSSPSHL